MAWPRALTGLALGLAAGACQAEPAEPRRAEGRGSLGDTVNRVGREATPEAAARPAAAPAVAAAGAVNGTAEPAPGTAQRRALMDAARPAIATVLRSPVEFVVRRVGVQDGWALLVADPQKPGGGAIDASHLDPDEERDGLTVSAILRFQNGRWNLVEHAIGPTDVWYCGYEGPPRSLLGC